MHWFLASTRISVAACCVVMVLLLCAGAKTVCGQSGARNAPGHNEGANRGLRLSSQYEEPVNHASPFDRLPREEVSDYSNDNDFRIESSPSPANGARPKKPPANDSADLLPRVLGIATCITVIVMSIGGFVHWGLWFWMRVPKQSVTGANSNSTSARAKTKARRRTTEPADSQARGPEQTADLLRQIALRFDPPHKTQPKAPIYQSRVPLNIPTRSQALSRPIVPRKQKPAPEPIVESILEPPTQQVEQPQTFNVDNPLVEKQLEMQQPTLPLPVVAQDRADAPAEDPAEDLASSFAESLFRDNLALRSQLSNNKRQAAAQQYAARSA